MNSFSRWNLKMAIVRPKHVFNFFMSWFLIISIRKLLVVLLTASPYRHLIYYTTGMANLKNKMFVAVFLGSSLWTVHRTTWIQSTLHHTPFSLLLRFNYIDSVHSVRHVMLLINITVEFSCNVMQETGYFVPLQRGIFLTEQNNVMANSEELIGSTEYLTL